jgi:hypothetical protein
VRWILKARQGDREIPPSQEIDPFGGAKPRLLRRGKEAPLRVSPEQAQAFRRGIEGLTSALNGVKLILDSMITEGNK